MRLSAYLFTNDGDHVCYIIDDMTLAGKTKEEYFMKKALLCEASNHEVVMINSLVNILGITDDC